MERHTVKKEAVMMIPKHSRLRAIGGRVKRVCAELDYSQRRMLEIQTGLPFLEDGRRSRRRVRSRIQKEGA
jgi:hypothetical protein